MAYETGAALLLALLVLLIGGLSLLLGQLSAVESRHAADRASDAALARAKDALIGRAASDENHPGALPCPALDAGGVVPLFHGNHCPTYIGHFPWKTLKTGELRDGHGELLWYALSPALRDDNSAVINSQTVTELSLDGQSNVAAIIFAPGRPLSMQNGRPSNALADYLEGSNADGDPIYSAGPSSAGFNDRVLPISRDELFRVVGKRVLAEVRGPASATALPAYGLRRYYNGELAPQEFPWADSDTDGLANAGTASGRIPDKDIPLTKAPPPEKQPQDWLRKNNWFDLIVYERLGPASARLTLGGLQVNVTPCTTAPCP